MSDFESFSGFDSGANAMDPAAFEKFKERMAAAAAQLKAMQIGEQKARKTEDELVKILRKFIQTGTKTEILMLVVKLLEDNVPAGFIVSILLISNPQMQQELGIQMLPPPKEEAHHEVTKAIQEVEEKASTLPDHYIGHHVLPLRIKIAIDNWIHQIMKRGQEHPHRVLKTVIDPEWIIRLPLLQLATFCLRDFLETEGIETKYELLKEFMDLMLDGILKKLKEQTQTVKELKEGN